MSKTKKSLKNVIASVVQVITLQLITLIVSRKVLSVYGSDINGVNAVFTNTLAWLMLIEGGFTFASSVALFKAYANKDTHQANRILSATKKALNKIGLLVGLGGVVLAIVAPFYIKTSLSYELLLYMFLLMAFATFFGLSFTRKYALIFSVKQELYFNTYIAVFVSIVVNAAVYLVALQNIPYLWIRVVFALGAVLTGVITAVFVKKSYPSIRYNEQPDMEAIKGTKDMVYNKFAYLVRSSVPIIYVASVAGAVYASVYAVYMIIFGFIAKLCMMVTNAVQNSLGQLIAEKSSAEVYKKFRVFEFAVIFMSFAMISVSTPMTLPFIRFYTKNVHDVDYTNWKYVLLFTLITVVQMVHIPSGIVMLMAGEFKRAKRIQLNSLTLLILGIVIGGFFGKITGILSGILIAALFLAVQEIVFTRSKYFKDGYHDLLKALGITGATAIVLILLGLSIVPEELPFIQIVGYTSLLSVMAFSILTFVTFHFFNDIFCELLPLGRMLIRR